MNVINVSNTLDILKNMLFPKSQVNYLYVYRRTGNSRNRKAKKGGNIRCQNQEISFGETMLKKRENFPPFLSVVFQCPCNNVYQQHPFFSLKSSKSKIKHILSYLHKWPSWNFWQQFPEFFLLSQGLIACSCAKAKTKPLFCPCWFWRYCVKNKKILGSGRPGSFMIACITKFWFPAKQKLYLEIQNAIWAKTPSVGF